MTTMTTMNDVIPSAPAYQHHMPWFVRLLGGRWLYGRREWRMRWGSLGIRKGLALSLCLFEEGFSLHLNALRLNAFIQLPFLRRFAYEPHEIMESWGLSYHPDDGALHLSWGRHTKVLWVPWRNWTQVAHDVRRPDESWVPYVASYEVADDGETRAVNFQGEPWKQPDGRHEETYQYRYLLRSGEVQERTATIYVERRIRRLKWLRWTPLFQRTLYAIDIKFSDEVGEESGSWKGGCIGCGYELRPDETPRECLKRMERERRF